MKLEEKIKNYVKKINDCFKSAGCKFDKRRMSDRKFKVFHIKC